MLLDINFFPLPSSMLQSFDYETLGFIVMKSEIIQNDMTPGAECWRKKNTQHYKKSPMLVTVALAACC